MKAGTCVAYLGNGEKMGMPGRGSGDRVERELIPMFHGWIGIVQTLA